MSDGLTDYWERALREGGGPVSAPFRNYAVPRSHGSPIVPRYEPNVWDDPGPDIDADAALVWINPPPFYFWLGRDAE